ncbi:MAG TPA: amino acid permease [Candidatus Limnocylindria bacterium]|nr:amino acid permease [Candidatus Limnocylindria bacterium]
MGFASDVETGAGADERQLAALGYRQQLSRSLGLLSNFSVGFTYLSPIVGVYTLFAFGLVTAGPAFIWTYPIVLIGQFLVVFTFAEIASQYPIAGGIFQWSKRLVGPRYGFMSGWMYTLALLITVAAVAFSANIYAAPLFGWEANSVTNILVAAAVIVGGGILNMLGIRRLANLARLGVAVEVAGTVGLAAWLLLTDRNQDVGVIFQNSGAGAGDYTAAFLAAILAAVWVFYGFEACGDIAEEVHDPGNKVPRAMMWTLLIGGLTTIFLVLALILAIPDLGAVIAGENAAPIDAILLANFGETGFKIALVMILFAYVSCTIAIQGAAVRLVYSYARDGMVPFAAALSRVNPRFHMPPGAVVVAVVVPVLITLLPSATYTMIINFATIGIYIGFQTVVAAAIVARRRGWVPSGKYNLGRWGMLVNVLALVYGVSAIAILSYFSTAGDDFFTRWQVPILAAIVFVAGLAWLLIARPTVKVQEGAIVEGAIVEGAMSEASAG